MPIIKGPITLGKKMTDVTKEKLKKYISLESRVNNIKSKNQKIKK